MMPKKILSILSICLIYAVSGIANAEIVLQPQDPFQVGLRASHLATGDINGDGYDDIVVTNMFSHSISIAYNNGEGGFDDIQEVPLENEMKNPTSVAIGNIDDDPYVDIAVSHIQDILDSSNPFQNNGVIILYGSEDGSFEQTRFSVDGSISTMLIVNVDSYEETDSDADIKKLNDLILGDNGDLFFTSDFTGQLEPGLMVYKNRGNRVFEKTTDLLEDGSIAYVTLGDYNNDTKPDVVSANQGILTINEVFELSLEHFELTLFKAASSSMVKDSTTIALDSMPFSTTVNDFNGDGQNDIATALVGDIDLLSTDLIQGSNGSLEVFLIEPSSSPDTPLSTIEFTENGHKSYNTVGSGFNVQSVDLDNDGDVDITMTMQEKIPLVDGTEYEPYLYIYENDGDGNFTEIAETLYPLDREPRYSVVSDFDNDGDQDIAVLCIIRDSLLQGAVNGFVHTFLNTTETMIKPWSIY